MNKPEIILQLERKLYREFTKVGIREISRYKENDTDKYSSDRNGNITGLYITSLNRFNNFFEIILNCSYLKKLTLRVSEISNIPNLTNLIKLEELNLNKNKINNISFLEELVNLKNLSLSFNQITDISALKKLKNLKQLNLSYNQISDISFLKYLKKLDKLNLSNNEIFNISILKEFKNLENIDLSINKITNISDILALRTLNNIKKLNLKGNTIVLEDFFIAKITINNFYSIKKEIKLNELSNKKFIFLLGENGSGKTVFLKALLIALKKRFIDTKTSKEDTGIINDILKNNSNFSLNAQFTQNKNNNRGYELNLKSNLYLKNLYAYGTNRNKISKTSEGEAYGFLTLFKDNEYLINTEEWIKEIERKQLKKITTISIDTISKILSDILSVENLKIEIDDTQSTSKVNFKIKENILSLNELSEGYKSIIIFVIDLIARITKDNPNWTKTQDFKAVVLVDELDLFLHPTWEKEICNKLSNWFPNIQFFITTHSPILVLGAPKDKTVIFKLANENNQTVIKERYDGKDIENWLPNILISSPLFGTNFLDKKSDEQIMQVSTEDSFPEMAENKKKIDILREKEKTEKFYLENLL